MSTSESPPTRARFYPQMANQQLLPKNEYLPEGLDTVEQTAMPVRLEQLFALVCPAGDRSEAKGALSVLAQRETPESRVG